MSCYTNAFTYLSAIRYEVNPELTPAPRGRPAAVSKTVINKAIAVAEERDLNKDSFTSNSDVMALVDSLMREEQEELGHNPRATLPTLCRSTQGKIVKQITPVIVSNGAIQNASRQRALKDPRNAISCAASWNAVAAGVPNGNFVHSWDECAVMLNAFGEKQSVKCTAAGRSKLSAKNLAPATTETQQQRRMLKMGLREFAR
jgi:hypothetical protein